VARGSPDLFTRNCDVSLLVDSPLTEKARWQTP
jgi:hypothetical protein